MSAKARIKRAEKAEKTGLYATLPKGLPPLLKAYRVHSKAARAGFTWESDEAMAAALAAERAEFALAASALTVAAHEPVSPAMSPEALEKLRRSLFSKEEMK